MSTQLFRDVPSDLDAEQALLGACLIDGSNALRVAHLLDSEDLYRDSHRLVWRAMRRLVDRAEPLTLLTLRAELERTEDLATVGGLSYLAELSEQVTFGVPAEYLARRLADLGTLRRMIAAASTVAGLAYDQPQDVDAALAQAQSALLDVQRGRRTNRILTPEAQAEMMLDYLSDVRDGQRRGLSTGLRDLDERTGGLYPGEFWVIGGRPGTGKTALMQSIAGNVASAGRKVLFVSVEMSAAQLGQRALAWETRQNVFRIRTGQFAEHEYEYLLTAAANLSQTSLYLVDDPDATPSRIRSVATEQAMRYGLDLIVIDYLQIINPDRTGGESTVATYTEISKQLRRTARALGVPMLVGSQLNRANEGRPDSKPKLSDLRETGAIEQDANVVLLLHREKQSLEDFKAGRPSLTNCEIGKNRQGQTGDVPLLFLPKMTRYVDRDWSEAERQR